MTVACPSVPLCTWGDAQTGIVVLDVRAMGLARCLVVIASLRGVIEASPVESTPIPISVPGTSTPDREEDRSLCQRLSHSSKHVARRRE